MVAMRSSRLASTPTVLAWLAATTVAIGVAWVGLRPVLDTAVPDRVAPLSADDVRRLALPRAASLPAAAPTPTATGTPPHASAAATVLDGWTVTTSGDGSLSYLRSFAVAGGSAVIRMVPGQVFLVSATPSPQYAVTVTQHEPVRLVVQFTATGRYDVIDAMWWNDRPYCQVSHVG